MKKRRRKSPSSTQIQEETAERWRGEQQQDSAGRARTEQICGGAASLWTERQHCGAQELLLRQCDMFVFTPRCAPCCILSHRHNILPDKRSLCPEQKHEGSSHMKQGCRQSSDNLFTCITAKCLICIYPLSYFLIRIRRL